MIDGVRIKVCGLTSLVDAEFADKCGADYLGFILYPKSPRHIPLIQFASMAQHLPGRKKVAVSVEPTLAELSEMRAAGFDFFQIHFRPDFPLENVKAWSEAAGPERLWLAPKLPPQLDVSESLLPLAKYFLLDTFHLEKFGGTGEAGDWAKFGRHRAAYAHKTWILSGGLSPTNIAEALSQTHANFVDVNSGVESAPGVKDHEKLKAFVVAVHKEMRGRAH